MKSKHMMLAGVRRVAMLSGMAAMMIAGPIAAAKTPLQQGADADVIATVNRVPIQRAQLDEAVRSSGQPDTPAQRQTLTEGLIARELIRQAAEKEKLGNTEQVAQAVRKARVDTENRLYIAQHMRPEAISEAQVRARYDAIVAELGTEEYKARVITVRDDLTAKAVLAKLDRGVPFETLAAENSVAPSRTDGGALPWFSFRTPVSEGHTQGLALPLALAVSMLDVGQISRSPVAVGNQRVIVKLDAKRPVVTPSYEQARASLRQTMESQASERAFTQLVGTLAAKAVIVPPRNSRQD
ncbi:foldase protein PrsA [Paraburkholderia terricola]|uniref:foldase protein PrsA n=1 Tax=Paraburkholderia terricola TaxID=169427 RepID=UPI001374D3C5|nr:peptidylprolyl isomerase [Paraburkholderia terricola]